ncbi:hypothetical protein FB2170_05510 [Maribacter sp. HTCC2170]|nr:hypothetical protein FB2170_05510 [Maribacter sp. HTCC2170]
MFLALCALAVSLTFSSCDLEDDGPNFHFVPLQIESVEMPESFDLEETYEIKVTYILPDGCTYYEGFDVFKDDLTTRQVVAIGSQRTDDEACTQAIREEMASFDFIVLHNQTYLFKFYQGEDADGNRQYLEVEVPVN